VTAGTHDEDERTANSVTGGVEQLGAVLVLLARGERFGLIHFCPERSGHLHRGVRADRVAGVLAPGAVVGMGRDDQEADRISSLALDEQTVPTCRSR